MDELHSEPAKLSVHHVDVFTDRAMAGNGLAVVSSAISLGPDTMLRIAQELRQFETIFLFDAVDGGAEARIFTPEEELGFAGHPVLGAAAVLHAGRDERMRSDQEWTIRVGGRPLRRRDCRTRWRGHLGRDGSGTRHVLASLATGRGHPIARPSAWKRHSCVATCPARSSAPACVSPAAGHG